VTDEPMTDEDAADLAAIDRLMAEAHALIVNGRLTIAEEIRLRTGLVELIDETLRADDEVRIRRLLGDLLSREDQA